MHNTDVTKGGVIFHQNEKAVINLLNRFLGIGICKNCGYKYPGILGYCEHCLELAYDMGTRLYHISSGEYFIRKKSHELQTCN